MCVLNCGNSGAGNGNIDSATVEATTPVAAVVQPSTEKLDDILTLFGTLMEGDPRVAEVLQKHKLEVINT